MFASVPLPGTRRGTIPIMALACGVMVANVYLCQPLLSEIAKSFGVSDKTAALVSVATQIGYTLGILFVVPLGDAADPAKLMRRLFLLTACGLIGAAFAPGIGVLVAASVSIAATCVVAQVLIPLATTLAGPEYRGRIVSALSTGLILGILLARTFSGLIAELVGSWRAPYLAQSLFVLAMCFILPGFLPTRPADRRGKGYFALLRSLPPLLKYRELRLSMALSACCFAAFSAIWATLAFHLATPTFGLGPGAAGLFGLWGAPGALMAPLAGRISDQWGPSRANAVSLISMTGCLIVAVSLGTSSVVALVVAINLLDFGQQCGQVANQARIFGLDSEIRGRLNTIYMVTTYSGGALGSLAAGIAWEYAGWQGVCLFGGGMILVAAMLLATSRTLFPPNWFFTHPRTRCGQNGKDDE